VIGTICPRQFGQAIPTIRENLTILGTSEVFDKYTSTIDALTYSVVGVTSTGTTKLTSIATDSDICEFILMPAFFWTVLSKA